MAEIAFNPHQRPPSVYTPAALSNTSSVPSSATHHSPMTPGTSRPHPGPNSRSSSGPGALKSPHVSHTPESLARSANYMHSFHHSVESPGTGLPGYPEFGHSQGPFVGVPNVGPHVPMSSVQGPKRAYRQRRKDPSCDACRERKVKCDATDSSSCTECSSRNVKCQFTKETNRRMSNIRHNQDLQKELAQAKSQVDHLRSILDVGQEGSPANFPQDLSTAGLPDPGPSHLPNHNLAHLPGPESIYLPMLDHPPRYEQRPPKRRRTAGTAHRTRMGSNMERYGHGIFKPPHPSERPASSMVLLSKLPALPAKAVADALVTQYHSTMHPTLPMIHWPSFRKKYEDVYLVGSFEGVPQIWISLLYAVFACGSLNNARHDGTKYLEVSKSLIDIWTEDPTLDHARVALLSCMFLVEMNLKSAGWTWAGFAVRIAFDIGLHCEAGSWPAVEEEMRRRVWWCIYTCECLLSLELGRPALIKEEDCNVTLPSPVDDQYMYSGSEWLSPTPDQSTSPLLPTIQVIGGIAKLLRVLKSRFLAKPALEAYDLHFRGCMQGFPMNQGTRIDGYVDPIELPPVMYLQNARLILHRHNLTPMSDAKDRSAALDGCASTAADTARLLRRSMQDKPTGPKSQAIDQNDTWERRMVSAASAFFCTHIWRCVLFLCFRSDFENAIWCARASAILGAARPVNVACGRYMEFFLNELTARMNRGAQMDADEDMIAYVSGDLQGSFEKSWIWKGVEGDFQLDSPLQSPNHGRDGPIAPSTGVAEWARWDNVLSVLDRLFQDQQQRQQQRVIQESSLRPPLMLPPLAPSPNPSKRMSIKDLI